jgi:uroporphyrinogen-III synthase
MRVLVTRPDREAARTAERLQALQHEALVDPLLKIEPLAFHPFPAAFDAVAITSANAIHAVSKENLARYVSLPLFAVGAQSAEAAREAGFKQVVAAAGDAQALMQLIAEKLPAAARVHDLAGTERAQDLAALLSRAKIQVETCIVYRAAAAKELGADTLARIRAGKIDAMLHYSLRSAETFLALVHAAKLAGAAAGIRHLCLSQQVAAPLLSAGFNVEIAARPNEDALFALLS